MSASAIEIESTSDHPGAVGCDCANGSTSEIEIEIEIGNNGDAGAKESASSFDDASGLLRWMLLRPLQRQCHGAAGCDHGCVVWADCDRCVRH